MITHIPIDFLVSDLQSPINQVTHGSTFPADLREWLDPSRLIKLVLEAVLALYWMDREKSGPDPESSHPQLILGLLAFGYATGLYSTDEIARRQASDDALRYLGLNRRFPLRQLILFRSQNRELVRRCLGLVLRRAWEIRFGKSSPRATTNTKFEIAFRNYFNDEAAERINRSLRADAYALPAVHAENAQPTRSQAHA